VSSPIATLSVTDEVRLSGGLLESVAFTWKETCPMSLGVPVNLPALFMAMPGGRPPDTSAQV